MNGNMKTPMRYIDLAYGIWKRCGQNISETRRILKSKHEFTVSRVSIRLWRGKYNWEVRAARAEAEEKYLEGATEDKALLLSLIKEKERLEDYLNNLPKGEISVQSTRAYNKVITSIVEVRERISVENKIENIPVENYIEIKEPQAVINTLWQAIEKKINLIVHDPGMVTAENVKDIKESMELIEKLTAKYCVKEEKIVKNLSKETLEKIKTQIYGL